MLYVSNSMKRKEIRMCVHSICLQKQLAEMKASLADEELAHKKTKEELSSIEQNLQQVKEEVENNNRLYDKNSRIIRFVTYFYSC